MEIGLLQLENVLSWSNLELDFSNIDFALFVGKSGSGKSNIFDGLTWTLFDRTARSKYDKSKVIQDYPEKAVQARGVVELVEGKDKYRIERLRGKTDSLSIYRNGRQVELRNPTYAQEELEVMLGMNYDTFVNIVYFAQGDAGRFLGSTSSDRISVISALLFLRDYDKAAKLAAKRHTELVSETAGHRGEIKTYEDIIGQTDLLKLRKNLKVATSALAKARKTLEERKEYLSKLDEKSREKDRIELLAREYKSEKANLISYIDKQEQKIEETKGRIVGEKELKKKLSRLKEKIESVKFYEKEKVEMDKQVVDLESEISILQTKFESLMERAADIESTEVKVGSQCPTCRAEITSVTLQHIKEEADGYRSRALEVNKRKKAKDAQLAELKKVQERVDKDHEEGKATREKHTALLQQLNRIGELKLEVQKLKSELDKDAKEARDKLRIKKAEYERRAAAYKKRYAAYSFDLQGEYRSELEELEGRERTLVAETEQLKYRTTQYQRAVDALAKLKKTLEDKDSELAKAEYWKQAFPKLKLQVISESVPFTEALANQYLSRMLNGVSLELVVDPSRAQNKVDIVIKYDDGTRRIFEGWNGGAQAQMSTAMFMALNKVASMRSGKNVNFIVLDEKFASIDSEARQDVLELLREVYSDRKLYAISHIDGIESSFDQVFRITSKNGISQIEQQQ